MVSSKLKRTYDIETKKPHRKRKCVKPKSGKLNTTLSLPIISDDKIYCVNDNEMQTPQDGVAVGQKTQGPQTLNYTVRLKCEVLNYEKIIHFENKHVIKEELLDLKKLSNEVTARLKKSRAKCEKKSLNRVGNSLKNVKQPVKKKSLISLKEKPNKVNLPATNSKALSKNVKENKNTSIQKVPKTGEKKPISNCTTWKTKNNEQNSQAGTSENLDQSSANLNNDVIPQGTSCSSSSLGKESAFKDVNLEELLPSIDSMSNDGLKVKLGENQGEKNKENSMQEPKMLQYTRGRNYFDLDNDKKDMKILDQISLQTAVETFMSSPQVEHFRGSSALKRGLCISWLSNNYVCSDKQCLYSHSALNLFTKKLKKYPSKFIMTVVVSMRHDLLFVDVALAAFKVISGRQVPVIWVTFLTYLVFYLSEPSDSRFLKFWANVARFFCELQKNYSTAHGFASLLSIFSEGEGAEEWKIIEFIKLLKQPPVAVPITFNLLQPVLKMNLPLEFLTAAVKSCIITQKDVLKVYWLVVPKIPVMTSSIQIVELLLKFCKTLEKTNHKDFADDLKQQLRGKVWSVKTKLNHQRYPLTASFQEEISRYSNGENCHVKSISPSEEKSEMHLSFLGSENNYFQPEEDFCNLLAQAVEFSPDSIPKPFRILDDVNERQVARIKQFFRNCQFDLLGKHLNDLTSNATERAAEEFLQNLFRMKISLQQGVDLVRIILLPCKSANAAKVIASISITLVLNMVRINEWEKAYTIVSLCQEKEINLVEGKVFYTCNVNTYDFGEVTQCRIVLLLIEIYAYKGKYGNAIELAKKYSLFSANNSLWQLTWKAHDEAIRVRILEDLLGQIILNQNTQQACDLFGMIWKEQNILLEPVDLKKFTNEMLILLLNQDAEEAINFYEKIKTDDLLTDTTIRAIVVTLVRQNRLLAAKSLVLSAGKNTYFIPEITHTSAIKKILSFWLDEEIYVIFDVFFDLLAMKTADCNPVYCNNVEIQVQESKPNSTVTSGLRPLCLGIINPSLKDACARIQRVLQYQFSPPVKLIIMPYYLKLDGYSVRLHLQKRIKNLPVIK